MEESIVEEENQDKAAKGRMNARDKLLDEYENSLGLPKYDQNFAQADKIKEYLEYGQDELERLTPEQCSEISGVLKSFAFHMQRARNREVARMSWAKGQLRKLVTPKLGQYRGCGSFENIFDAACLGDNYTADIMSIRDFAQQRADRLEMLSMSMRDRAEGFKDLAWTKRERERYAKD